MTATAPIDRPLMDELASIVAGVRELVKEGPVPGPTMERLITVLDELLGALLERKDGVQKDLAELRREIEAEASRSTNSGEAGAQPASPGHGRRFRLALLFNRSGAGAAALEL